VTAVRRIMHTMHILDERTPPARPVPVAVPRAPGRFAEGVERLLARLRPVG